MPTKPPEESVRPGLTPNQPDEPDPRMAGLPTNALRAEVRRRRLQAAGRDTRASATSATGVYVETTEFLDVLRRLMRAAGRRVGAMDIDTLGLLFALLTDDSEATLGEACWALRRNGYSWRVIGEQLGMTKQSAFERFAPYRPADMPVGSTPPAR